MGRFLRMLPALLSHLTALLTLAALTRRLWSNLRFLRASGPSGAVGAAACEFAGSSAQ